ncbi:hypothetical protein AXF42_Ash010435 [Apostasia shenzhenica]|uniref:Srp40 C-terminal domain-containing protein n=1 Tax=Apostasia shenzhenica TaxID=1088818 RepID=A0A2I0BE30_9ASPA|nr:hypothetical protein AXF42_Ash010435 [Apostasia shenzhenica]
MEKRKKHMAELVEIKDRKGSSNFVEVVKGKIKELNSLTDELSRKAEDVEKSKGVKKKKRKKEATDSVARVELGINQVMIAKKSKDERHFSSNKRQELADVDDLTKDLQEYPGGKDKKKDKKKQQKSTSAKLVEESVGVENSANMDLQKPDFHKESVATSELNGSVVEKTTHKKRKRSSKENSVDEKKVAADELKQTKLEVSEDTKEIGDHLALRNWKQSPVKKKRKAAQSNRDSHDTSETLSSDYLVKDEQKTITEELGGPQLANGNIEKNGNEGSTGPKSMNKEKRSSELTTINAFQRVKVDQVQFVDERLQDNSYWALDNSGTGYGAKAQEVLGQVRGSHLRLKGLNHQHKKHVEGEILDWKNSTRNEAMWPNSKGQQ